MLRLILLVHLVAKVLAVLNELTPPEIITKNGYKCETHFITTTDGYILTFHRIPFKFKTKNVDPKPAVLLVHGLFSNSNDFLKQGNYSLGFLLADAGFDVWLANCRGTIWSQNHTTINHKTQKKEFFNFSWHEIGIYDIPNAIDYILTLKNEDSLFYVGYSQGTTTFFVTASTLPEYNKKIRLAHLLAPSAVMDNADELVKTFLQATYFYEDFLDVFEVYETSFRGVLDHLAARFCSFSYFSYLCSFYINFRPQEIDRVVLPAIEEVFSQQSSMKQVLHYLQLFKSPSLANYDYGTTKNVELYGTKVPPTYNLKKITAPVALYYATNDFIQSNKGLIFLKKQLPNIVYTYGVPDTTFQHTHFLTSKNIFKLVSNEVLRLSKQH